MLYGVHNQRFRCNVQTRAIKKGCCGGMLAGLPLMACLSLMRFNDSVILKLIDHSCGLLYYMEPEECFLSHFGTYSRWTREAVPVG